MNGIHRVALTVAGMATLATVGGAFAAQGYVEAQQAAQAAESERAAQQAAADLAARTLPPLSDQIIYVNPQPTPQVINVVQTAEPSATPPVIHVVVTAPAGEDEHEGEEDDD
jgi:type II secretory pathway pseudopilin PulG